MKSAGTKKYPLGMPLRRKNRYSCAPTHQPNARSPTDRQNSLSLTTSKTRVASKPQSEANKAAWGAAAAHLAPEHGGDDGCDLPEAGVGSAQLATPDLVLVHHDPLLHNLRAPTAPAGSTGLSGRQ